MIILLRLSEVCKAKGCGKSSLYDEIQAGLFTPPVKTGKRASAWPSYEVQALNKARIAGKTEAEIKQIVSYLLAARRTAGDAAVKAILNDPSDLAPLEGGHVGNDTRLFAATSSSQSHKEQSPNTDVLKTDGGQI